MNNFIITKLLYKNNLIKEKLTVIDCGARGSSFQDWQSVHDKLIIHGFDPDESECDRLNREASAYGFDHHYYPHFIAKSEDKRDFYLTNNSGSNSLYEPDHDLLSRFRSLFCSKWLICSLEAVGLKERIDNVMTISLDHWASQYGISDVDFIKLDVQGAELEILEGGASLLRSVMGINIEVWFAPLYNKQPLFSDIDPLVRSKNFKFFTFHIYDAGQFVGRMASPVSFTRIDSFESQKKAGQLVTADAFYFRDPIQEKFITVNKIAKLICLSELCYQIEYSFELLNYLKVVMANSRDVTMVLDRIISESAEYYASYTR